MDFTEDETDNDFGEENSDEWGIETDKAMPLFSDLPPSFRLWPGYAHAHAECHTRNCQMCIVTGPNTTSH